MLLDQLEVQEVYSTQGQAALGFHQISLAIGQRCQNGSQGCFCWESPVLHAGL